MLFIHETFVVYKLETFKKCKEVKHIVITIIAITYIFNLMWYFISSWNLLSENLQDPLSLPLTKSTHPFLKSHHFTNIENFSGPPAKKREDTRVHISVLCKIRIDLLRRLWRLSIIGRSTTYSCRAIVFV